MQVFFIYKRTLLFIEVQKTMLKCHLSTIMGERRLKIADVARDTDINRGTITRMYHEEASRVELDVVETLCRYLDIQIGDLYEIVDEKD